MNTYSLTVKHVSADGDISIHAASAVRLAIPRNYAPAFSPAEPTVYADLENGVTASFDGGTVYVMNAAGKTVDTFHLRDNQPQAA